MRLVMNSDVLFHRGLVRKAFGGTLGDLISACAAAGVDIVIPQTTLLEYNCKQEMHAQRERNDLRQAIQKLESYDVSIPEVDVDKAVTVLRLQDLISTLGANVHVVKPTFRQYASAHERACKHLPPDKPPTEQTGKDRDEMRDMIIWEISLDVARAHDGAILLSKDAAHTRGKDLPEAVDVRLAVFEDPNDVIAWLDENSFPYLRSLATRCCSLAASKYAQMPVDPSVTTLEVGEVRLTGKGPAASVEFSFRVEGEDAAPVDFEVIALFVSETSAEISMTIVNDALTIGPELLEELDPFSARALIRQGAA